MNTVQPLLGAVGLIAIAAATPGPNNFIVMRAAGTLGLRHTLPLIAAIVIGSLVMLGLASTGFAIASPAFASVLSLVSGAYLVILGLSIARQRLSDEVTRQAPVRLQTPLGLFFFQLANPKTWLMIVAALGSGASLMALITAMMVITTSCLLVWSWFGSLLQARLQRPRFARWFNFISGGVLAGSASTVLL